MATTPFTNVMEDGNYPDTASSSGELTVQHQSQDTPSQAPWAGDDERPIQDNGTGGSHLGYVMGSPSGNTFPPCYTETNDDEATNIHDYGLREDVEVGHDASIAQYGISGPAAGGGILKNTVK